MRWYYCSGTFYDILCDGDVIVCDSHI